MGTPFESEEFLCLYVPYSLESSDLLKTQIFSIRTQQTERQCVNLLEQKNIYALQNTTQILPKKIIEISQF